MIHKLIKMLVLAFVMTGLLSIDTAAQGYIAAEVDTYVDLNAADSSFDGYALLVDYSSLPTFEPTRRAFLRFHLSGLTGDVGDGVTLHLYVTSAPLTTAGTLALWRAGDDWNGGDTGLGDGGDLTWNSSSGLVGTLITTQSADTTSGSSWITFTGTGLKEYINAQRVAHGGNDYASFMIEWQSCSTCDFFGDSMEFEDKDDFRLTGNAPRLGPAPTSVTLLSFAASAGAQRAVEVRWETASEVETLGFDLYRAASVDGLRTKVNGALIPAKRPGSPMGASYEFLDEELALGLHYYWLETVDVRGGRELHGPVSVMAGGYRLYLPLTVKD